MKPFKLAGCVSCLSNRAHGLKLYFSFESTFVCTHRMFYAQRFSKALALSSAFDVLSHLISRKKILYSFFSHLVNIEPRSHVGSPSAVAFLLFLTNELQQCQTIVLPIRKLTVVLCRVFSWICTVWKQLTRNNDMISEHCENVLFTKHRTQWER